jgi:hypothetical protein
MMEIIFEVEMSTVPNTPEPEETDPYLPPEGWSPPSQGYESYDSPPDVNVPLWEDAHSYSGGTYRLKVQRQNPDGTRDDIGWLPADASDASLIAKWPSPGTFLVMPVDEHGAQLRTQPYRLNIAADHSLLRKLGGAAPGAQPTSSTPDALVQFLTRQLAAMERREELRDIRFQEEKAAARLEREQLEQRKIAFAVEAGSQQTEIQGRLIDQNSARADAQMRAQEERAERMMAEKERAHQMNMEVMRQNSEQQRAAEASRQQDEMRRRDQQRDDEMARRDRDRADEILRRDREREESRAFALEREQSREKAFERDRLFVQANMESKREFFQQQMEQQREWQDAKMKLVESQDPIATVKKLVGEVVPLAAALGIDADKLAGLFGGGSKSALETIAGTVSDIAKSQFGGGAPMGAEQAQMLEEHPQGDEDLVQVQLGDGQTAMVTRAQLQEYQQAQAEAASAEQARAAQVFAKEGEEAPEPPSAPTDESLPEQPAVDLKVAKPSRKALRMLVGELSGSPESEWLEKVARCLRDTPEAIEYLKIVSIRGALAEAGAPAEMCEKIVNEFSASIFAGMLPEGESP